MELFQIGCERDLEGIVAKPKQSPYPGHLNISFAYLDPGIDAAIDFLRETENRQASR